MIRNDQVAQGSLKKNTDQAAEPLRFITATSLFDGHDASINIIRRLLQNEGAEVIHLGHNRSVDEVVLAALQEDADAIAISSYQGGHNEYFAFMIDRLRAYGASHIRVLAAVAASYAQKKLQTCKRRVLSAFTHQKTVGSLALKAWQQI